MTHASGKCRICFCTDRRACDGGCTWADGEHTLCSSCVALERYSRSDVRVIARAAGVENAADAPSVVIAILEAFEERGKSVV